MVIYIKEDQDYGCFFFTFNINHCFVLNNLVEHFVLKLSLNSL